MTSNFVSHSFQAIARLGSEPTDSDELRVQKSFIMVAVCAVIPVFILVMGPMYILFQEPGGGLGYILFGIFALVNVFFYKEHHDLKRFLYILGIGALPSHLLVVLFLGGFVNAGGIPLWGLAFPVLVILVFYGLRPTIPWLIAFMVNCLLSIYLQPWLRSSNNLPVVVGQTIFAVNILAVSSLIVSLLAYVLSQRNLAFRLLRGEQEKAENLLLNILPRDIAAILKDDPRTIAEHYDEASILFADVVNFTPMSARMTPIELVELLNEVFSHFDLLVDKYGLEKIKTIGDCYMVASGVPRPRADHAHALTRMALEMRDFVGQQEFRGQRLNFRMGLNSGSVVAGVIGRKKFIYDLWGDAVNTASRMESHGVGGTVQITRSIYDLIKDDFICEPRGVVNVKGKGEMEVWHVVAPQNAA